jgi:hypothetical protein
MDTQHTQWLTLLVISIFSNSSLYLNHNHYDNNSFYIDYVYSINNLCRCLLDSLLTMSCLSPMGSGPGAGSSPIPFPSSLCSALTMYYFVSICCSSSYLSIPLLYSLSVLPSLVETQFVLIYYCNHVLSIVSK